MVVYAISAGNQRYIDEKPNVVNKPNIVSLKYNDTVVDTAFRSRLKDTDKLEIILDNICDVEWGRRKIVYNNAGEFETNGNIDRNKVRTTYTLRSQDIGYYVDAKIHVENEGYYYLSSLYDIVYFNYCLPHISLFLYKPS